MSWAEASVEIFGHPVKWTDLVGNVFALATVLFAMRKSLWTWPVQFTGAVLLFIASISAHVTGNALKQALFAILAIYGWWRWRRGSQGHELAVRPATGRERATLIAALLVGTALVTVLFKTFNLSWYPGAPWALVAADAYIFVGGAVATWAQGRALVDFWIVWVLVDLVGVPVAYNSGLTVSATVYVVFFAMVIYGFVKWLREYRTTTQAKLAVAS
ncbi:nicotinamide mononucleotide transporter [Nonomuraea sp. NN258]|uniref:nicotinamide mononucleotide transporter family protein n=1 Tax=Nonomuraea antri TaxID=2730852 RepID=UPI001568766D|nr:nicotinamide mononucleotide transporter family protein [Nonomuraea antri]NRQ34181.1 nicotinamide mononucleotide transporter [Nonomuraea antri]